MPLHTQREEDIKEFKNQFNLEIIFGKNSKTEENIADFISNIYIKIAEAQIKKLGDKPRGESWAELNEHEQWGYRKAQTDEINYWQEELDKLK